MASPMYSTRDAVTQAAAALRSARRDRGPVNRPAVRRGRGQDHQVDVWVAGFTDQGQRAQYVHTLLQAFDDDGSAGSVCGLAAIRCSLVAVLERPQCDLDPWIALPFGLLCQVPAYGFGSCSAEVVRDRPVRAPTVRLAGLSLALIPGLDQLVGIVERMNQAFVFGSEWLRGVPPDASFGHTVWPRCQWSSRPVGNRAVDQDPGPPLHSPSRFGPAWRSLFQFANSTR
jgi:hypothetical protein